MAIRSFKLFWVAHKWTGIAAAVIFVMIALTGFMLLLKKRVDWIQPPTLSGQPGTIEQFISIGEATSAVLAVGHPDFTAEADIDRIDVRPRDRTYKFTSRLSYAEIQVCAVSGAILSQAVRRSDLLEDIHDGSIAGDWVHGWIMPIVPIALLFLVFSGIWLWIEPIVRKRRRRRTAGRTAGIRA